MMNCAFLNNIKDFNSGALDKCVLLCDKHKNIRVSKSEQLPKHRVPTCFEIFCLCNNKFTPLVSKVNKCTRANAKKRICKSRYTNSVHRLTANCTKSVPCFLNTCQIDDVDRTVCSYDDRNPMIEQPFENNNFNDVSLKNLNPKLLEFMYDDTDVIPVKLKRPPRNGDNLVADEKLAKMNNTRSPERKQNSWGRILKDQNSSKTDSKKVTSNVGKAKYQGTQPRQLQQSAAYQQNIVQQQTKSKQKQMPVKELYPVPITNAKRYSNHTLHSVDKRSSTSLNSESSMSGESIMLIDRSVQCSSTNLENVDNIYHNFSEINQAGDNGLAFFNPVRTLNFLVKELRGKVSEASEDENMARIIRDMENTVTRLSKTTPQGFKDNLSALISEDDLKCVLEILQNSPKMNKATDVDKGTSDLQIKLEQTCSKLEDMCRAMEKTANSKMKEEKQTLFSDLNEKTEQLKSAEEKIKELESVIAELKGKTEEDKKAVMTMRDIQVKYTTLNSVLNEQVQDAKRENERLHNEMKFLFLEKEKNSILMKTKDDEIIKMRENLEEIKILIADQLNSFQMIPNEKDEILQPQHDLAVERQQDFNRPISAVLWSNVNARPVGKSGHAPMCSSPATSTSPALEDDESWRRISKVAHEVHPVDTKTAGIKESLRNLFDEMKKQSKLNNNLSIQNLINLDEPGKALTNWSDQSDDDMNSIRMLSVSDTETNFSK